MSAGGQTAEEWAALGNCVNGANIAGFPKVANAMMDQGLVSSLSKREFLASSPGRRKKHSKCPRSCG
jgi:hypothetical protein